MPREMAHSDGHQDYGWTNSKTQQKTKAGAQEALRRGQVDIEEKFSAPNHKTGPTNAKKLDEDTGSYKHASVGHDFKVALMQARAAKKLTQDQLGQQCNLPKATIQSYENGKAIPEGQVISKLNRVLGVTLPKVQKPKAKKDEL